MQAVTISLLRGVNLGASRRIRMEPLCALYESLGLRDVRHLLQSGNVLFRSSHRDHSRLATRIEDAIESEFGFRSAVILRTTPELREIISRSPFAERTGLDPSRLAVHFLPSDPGSEARQKLSALQAAPDELHTGERELYLYFTNGMARPTLTSAMLDRALNKMQGTSRNWNTVLKLLELADRMAVS